MDKPSLARWIETYDPAAYHVEGGDVEQIRKELAAIKERQAKGEMTEVDYSTVFAIKIQCDLLNGRAEPARKRPRDADAPVPTTQVLQDMGEWFEEQMTQGLDPENLGASPEFLSFINECIDYAGTESHYEPCRRRRA